MSDEDIQTYTCFFCERGRHSECMKKIPRGEALNDDCSFGTVYVDCDCCNSD